MFTPETEPTLHDIHGDAHVRTRGLPGYEEWLDARGDRTITDEDIAWADAMEREELRRREEAMDRSGAARPAA